MAAAGSVVADQAAMVAEDQAVATTAPEEPQASGGKQAPEEANATLEMYPGGTWNALSLRPVIRAQPSAGDAHPAVSDSPSAGAMREPTRRAPSWQAS